jgi:DNA adenine methylase
MSTTTLRPSPPLKWHGGKHYLASKIVALMPEHHHYVEAFAGGLSVLLAKDPSGVSEVVNDLDRELTNFWRVLQGSETFEAFRRRVEVTPFSEVEWEDSSRMGVTNRIDSAAQFFVRCRQSLAGRMDSFASLSRSRTRRGMNEQASAWLTAVDGLSVIHARLRRIAILSRDALDVIRQQDGPGTLFYLDPPYLAGTRASAEVYTCEMTESRHAELLDLVRGCKGKVMLSGYPSELYDRRLNDWTRHTFDLPNHASGEREKRRMTEVVWCNY